jgi:hypothetical protein
MEEYCSDVKIKIIQWNTQLTDGLPTTIGEVVKKVCVSVLWTYFMYFSDLNIMQLHVRGQGNHVIECEGTETVGQIKVSYLLYFYLPASILLLDVLY